MALAAKNKIYNPRKMDRKLKIVMGLIAFDLVITIGLLGLKLNELFEQI